MYIRLQTVMQISLEGQKGNKFTYQQMRTLILENKDKPMKKQQDVLSTAFDNWISVSNEKQIDDVCLIGLRVQG